MQRGRGFIFENKRNLYLLLNFRLNGYTIDSLALIFHCDKKAIRYHCEKNEYFPLTDERISVLKTVGEAIVESEIGKWRLIEGERINSGFSYKDYVKKYSPQIPSSSR